MLLVLRHNLYITNQSQLYELMKKFKLLFALTVVTAAAFAQVPNNNFELWETETGMTSEEPTFWSTSNPTVEQPPVSSAANVTKATGADAYNTTSVKLLSIPVFGVFKATGALVSGTIEFVQSPSYAFLFTGGFPYTSRPGFLTGYYKYTPATNDSGRISVLLTKWNMSSQTRETVATGAWYPKNATAGYEQFGVQLNYTAGPIGDQNPDTALIVILSSNDMVASGSAGSTLFVDDLLFQYGASINEVTASSINVYPNPATDRLIMDVIPGEHSIANIYDMTGRLVNKLNVTGNSIDVSVLNNGQYILELRNDNGMSRSTFAKQ